MARVLDPGVDLVAQTRDAHHVVLVEVCRVDRAELDALEQWGPLVLGQLQHALVEVEPRQLAIQVERGVVQLVMLVVAVLVGGLLAHRLTQRYIHLRARCYPVISHHRIVSAIG